MYTINKIECFFPDGFKQVITTDNVVEEIPVKQVERFLTQTDFQTTDYPDLQARKLLKYSKVRNKYQVTFYVEAGANLTLLQTAKYLKITLQDGTIIPFIDTNELTLEQISNTGWKGLFVFTELYSNTDNEISYLTYPEIGSTNVNKLQYANIEEYYNEYANRFQYLLGVSYADVSNLEYFEDYTSGTFPILFSNGDSFSAGLSLTSPAGGSGKFLIVNGTHESQSWGVRTAKYIYTEIKHKAERIRGAIITQDIEEITHGVKSIDYDVINCRFYLTLEQKNELLKNLHKVKPVSDVKFTDYLGNEFTSKELIDPKIEEEPDIKDLYSFDLVLKYNQIINYYE